MMDTDIALMTMGALLAKAVMVAAFAGIFYRILRGQPEKVRVESHSRYALERGRIVRHRH